MGNAFSGVASTASTAANAACESEATETECRTKFPCASGSTQCPAPTAAQCQSAGVCPAGGGTTTTATTAGVKPTVYYVPTSFDNGSGYMNSDNQINTSAVQTDVCKTFGADVANSQAVKTNIGIPASNLKGLNMFARVNDGIGLLAKGKFTVQSNPGGNEGVMCFREGGNPFTDNQAGVFYVPTGLSGGGAVKGKGGSPVNTPDLQTSVCKFYGADVATTEQASQSSLVKWMEVCALTKDNGVVFFKNGVLNATDLKGCNEGVYCYRSGGYPY